MSALGSSRTPSPPGLRSGTSVSPMGRNGSPPRAGSPNRAPERPFERPSDRPGQQTPEELQRKCKELDALVAYLRSVVEAKDDKIASLEAELTGYADRHAQLMASLTSAHDTATASLQNELDYKSSALRKAEEELEVARMAARENSLLQQRVRSLEDELTAIRTRHAEEVQKVRADVARVRANLAAEFHLALETALREKATEALLDLPQKAREALAEREILRYQLREQDQQIFDTSVASMNLQKEVEELRFAKKQLAKEVELHSANAAGLRARLAESEARAERALQKMDDYQGQNAALHALSDQYAQCTAQLVEAQAQARDLSGKCKRLKKALSGVCARYGLRVDMFYAEEPSRPAAGGPRASGKAPSSARPRATRKTGSASGAQQRTGRTAFGRPEPPAYSLGPRTMRADGFGKSYSQEAQERFLLPDL